MIIDEIKRTDILKEGTVPVPSDRSCAVRWCCYYLLRNYRIGGSHGGGGETPMNVQVFEHISRATQRSIHLLSEKMIFFCFE
jgi:hypothetical protein